MKKLFLLAVMSVLFLISSGVAMAAKPTTTGFDEFGYNRAARIFVGTGSSWCQGKLHLTKEACDLYMGIYANDQLVMKWNSEWDRGNAENWANGPYAAWENNEWNGQVPGGSGEVWHYKIKWVGALLENSPLWVEGGYAIWGQFETIMDQGTSGGEHIWYTKGIPAGYGAK